MRLAAILAFLSTPALASPTAQAGGDTIVIRESEHFAAEVEYNNGLNQMSKEGTYTVEINGVVVDVTVEVDIVGQAERVTVVPRDPGLIAYPAEADVEDGESVTVQIMPPLS